MAEISIVLIAYNVESYIDQCIQSIIQQTFKDFELICVDDGSTDHTLSVIESYKKKDSRISIIKQKNRGAGAARNTGLKHVHGKYTIFLDSDDFFEPDFLESLHTESVLKQLDLCVCHAYEYSDKKQKVTRTLSWVANRKEIGNNDVFSYRDSPGKIFQAINTWAWNKLIRTALIRDNNLMFQEIRSSTDNVFVSLLLVCAERVFIIERPLIYYRIDNPNSLQRTKEKTWYSSCLSAYLLKKKLIEINKYCDVKRSFINKSVNNVVYYYNSLPHNSIASKRMSHVLRYEFSKILDLKTFDYTYYYDKKAIYRFLEITGKPIPPELDKYVVNSIKPNEIKNELLKTRIQLHKIASSKTHLMASIIAYILRPLYTEKKQFVRVRNGINKTIDRDKKIIVSLTSYPARIETVPNVLHTLLTQTIKPDKIILYLAGDQFSNKIPICLTDCIDAGVEVCFCEDLKPHKKYYYAMQSFPNDIIITVDDDMLYPPTLIEDLYNSYLQHPRCVSATRTHLIKTTDDGVIEPYSKWVKEYVKGYNIPSMQLIATGVGGVLYPPNIMNKILFSKEKIIDNCLFADDLWLKIIEVLSNVRVVQAVDSKLQLKLIDGTQEDCLSRNNLDQGENDVQWDKILCCLPDDARKEVVNRISYDGSLKTLHTDYYNYIVPSSITWPTQINEYLRIIQKMESTCVVFFIIYDDASKYWKKVEFPAKYDFPSEVSYRQPLIKIISDDTNVQILGEPKSKITYHYAYGDCKFELVSAGFGSGGYSYCSIYDGNSWGYSLEKRGRGLNILVYSKKSKKLVDYAVVDLHSDASANVMHPLCQK